MSIKPFFPDGESAYFDKNGGPLRAGIYEFKRYDGRKIIYRLAFTEGDEPRLKLIRASRPEDFPNPPHALDGEWIRYQGALPDEVRDKRNVRHFRAALRSPA